MAKIININGELLRGDIARDGLNMARMSRAAKRCESYITQCCKSGKMDEDVLDMVCEFGGFKKRNYEVTVQRNEMPKKVGGWKKISRMWM